jgi:hypothetical protein
MRVLSRADGYGVIGYLVITGVVLLIIAGTVLLVSMVLSSLATSSTSPSPSVAPGVGDCSSSTWFDAMSGTCVPRRVCASGEEYVATQNTCAAPAFGPKADELAPSFGLVTGGTEIRIAGTGFQPGATVVIDGVPAVGVEVVSDGSITATTPPSSSLYPVDVLITNPDGTSTALDNAFTYVALPVERATEVRPSEGSKDGGETVIIKGNGFVEGARVAFGGRTATDVVVVDSTTLRVTTPIGSLGPVVVNVRNADEEPYALQDAFVYVDQPPRVVMLVRPASGAMSGGTKVTIAGTGFAPDARVIFGGKKATEVEVVSSTKITAITPAGDLGLVDVGVRNPGAPPATLVEGFEFVEAPMITGVKPADGPETGDTKVTITGTGFLSGATVTFDGADATAIKVVDDATITVKTPKGTAGPVTLVVTNPDQPPATAKKAFTYVVAPEPAPSRRPIPRPTSALPACLSFRLPDATGAAGGALGFDAAALFPSSMAFTDPVLGGATFTGDSGVDTDGSITWQASPPRIVWLSGPGSSSGTIQFTYTASSCAGVGAGSLSVFAN